LADEPQEIEEKVETLVAPLTGPILPKTAGGSTWVVNDQKAVDELSE
jgi:hypothetical protein